MPQNWASPGCWVVRAIETFLGKLRWYHATRGIGAIVVLWELFFAAGTPERGTIILAGMGVLGFDFVQRAEKRKDS